MFPSSAVIACDMPPVTPAAAVWVLLLGANTCANLYLASAVCVCICSVTGHTSCTQHATKVQQAWAGLARISQQLTNNARVFLLACRHAQCLSGCVHQQQHRRLRAVADELAQLQLHLM